jgi:hypothetical protein
LPVLCRVPVLILSPRKHTKIVIEAMVLQCASVAIISFIIRLNQPVAPAWRAEIPHLFTVFLCLNSFGTSVMLCKQTGG